MSCVNTEGTDFPIENIPFGIYSIPGVNPVQRVCTAIGNYAVDLNYLVEFDHFKGPLLTHTTVFAQVSPPN
jgi:Fumarylacetoacetase N-terminal